MDNLGKMNEERMKEAIKDYEDKQKVILKNQSNNAEKKMELLLTKYKDAEANAKAKLEEKGYSITIIDNAPEGEYPSGTSLYAINNEKAGTKAGMIINFVILTKVRT